MTTLELLKKYLASYFVEKKPEEIFSLLTEDIHCYGFADGVEVENMAQGRAMLAQAKNRRYMDCKLAILKAKQVTPDCAMVLYTLTCGTVTVQLRLTGHSRMTEEGCKLYFLNFCVEDPQHTSSMFEEKARTRREKIAQNLIGDSMPGGVMGGYMEEHFPFYYINDNMLRYLGYADEAEFIADIDGLIDRCMHPEDRDAVNETVDQQIRARGEYVVDYRMRKKDGSYIWVHDIGKKIKAEDGRDAIISACSDITPEKDRERFLDGLVTSLNGDLAMLAIDAEHRRTIPIYVSDQMGAKQGISREDYLRTYSPNAMNSIYESDRERVWASIMDAIQGEKAPSISFRILDPDHKPKWINAAFSRHGEDQGLPVILVLFTACTVQNELQLHALNQDGIGIALIDAASRELYYVNDSMYHMLGVPVADYVGKLCPEVLLGCGGSCHDCQMQKALDNEKFETTACLNGRWLSLHTERKPWADKTVVSVYAKDITDQHLLKEQEEESNRLLQQQHEMMQNACDFAHLLTWVYDIPNDRMFPSQRLQQDFGMPKVVENYPESWFKMGRVQPAYVELHRQKVLAIKHGSDREEFEAEVRHKDGVHWARITLNRLQGNPNLAACSSQLIDNEKQLQARVNLEKERVLSGERGLRGYVVSNVSKNAVCDRDSMHPQAHRTVVGMTIDQAIESALPDIMEKDREKYRALHDRSMLLEAYQQGKTHFEFVGHRVADDGALYWIRSALNLVKDPASDDIFLYEYLYDIHARKMLEEVASAAVKLDYERVASVNLFANQMTQINPDGMDGYKNVEILNYTERAAQYVQSAVLKEEQRDILEKTSVDRIRAELKDKDCFEFVYRVAEPGGGVGWRRLRYSYYDREMGICLVTRTDVTYVMRQENLRAEQLASALKQTQEALKAKESLEHDRELLCAALFSLVPMVIAANVTQGYYSMLNYDHYMTRKAAESGTYEELIDVGVSTVPEDQQEAFRHTFCKENVIRAYQNGEKSLIFEHQQLGDDGVWRWIETRCVFVQDEKTGDLHTITLAKDITASKQEQLDLQQALKAAESATKAKSEFLSRMSHEIRTPMNAIMGMTAIAKENRSDFQQVAECLNKIDMSSHFLLTLINDILEMSRIESGRTEVKQEEFNFDFLIESVRTVVEPLAQKANIRYDFINHSKTDSHYEGDAVRIQQVLVNIITNAIKFTKSGGRVRFSVNIDSETEEQTNFRFTIADTGIGMSEAFMRRMFQPFTQEDGSNTSEFGGSGLGLAISKSLVEAMGGTISAESFLGVGSTFVVTLPLKRLTYTASPIAPPTKPAQEKLDYELLKGRRILLAEDHPLNVTVARKLLERRGLLVTVAGDGEAAVEVFEKAAIGFFDAILMDIRMPRMDGWNATRAIRALNRPDARTVPIIAMTANALDEDRRHSYEVGMNEHLAKPIDPPQLYAVLSEQIGRAKKQ